MKTKRNKLRGKYTRTKKSKEKETKKGKNKMEERRE